MTPILALWATPRSTSTPFEWMMRQRGDFRVHHEPFNEAYYYGADRLSVRDDDITPKPDLSFESVWTALRHEAQTANVFVKDFAYSVMHMADDDFLGRFRHSFLIRDPAKVLPSLYHHWPDFTPDEAGFAPLRRMFDMVCQRDGRAPPVIASDDLLDRPHEIVEAYCRAVGIPFLADALTWRTGGRDEVSWYDGGSWHGNLRGSTGIERQPRNYVDIEHDDRLKRAYDEALPHYRALLDHKLKPVSQDAPS
ncbi:MAG: hypothetical protein ACR2PM_16110 [Hyphomicrobiales bacterium]